MNNIMEDKKTGATFLVHNKVFKSFFLIIIDYLLQ